MPATKRRRRKAVAVSNPRRRRRAANTHRPRRTNARRRNSTRVYVIKKNRRRMNGRRRNPEILGMRGAEAGKAILSGLVGVYATKQISPIVANAIPSVGSSPIFTAIIQAAVAYGGGMLISKWDKGAGQGFMFGGLMQAGSSLLNLVVSPNPLSLSGLGDFQPASFAVPQNPIMAAARQRAIAVAAPAAGAPAGAGMGAALMFR